MSAAVGVQQWGTTVGGRSLVAWGTCGLNDVQGWGLGEGAGCCGGAGDDWLFIFA